MPVYLNSDPFAESTGKSIHIGLINNMPDGALEATERQFLKLLESAAGTVDVHLSLYALPEVPRTEVGRRLISRHYTGIENLWDTELDGLIVTGTEPKTSNLKEEPYWIVWRASSIGLSTTPGPRSGPAWRRTRPFSTPMESPGDDVTRSSLECSSVRKHRITR